MVVGDPALVVLLVGTGGGAGGLVSGERLDDVDLPALLDGGLGAARLREEGLDPGLVDEVESAAEDTGQEDVQEDAA